MKKSFLLLSMFSSFLAFAAPIDSQIGKGILLYDKDAGLKDTCIQINETNLFTEDARVTTYTLDLVKSKEELFDKISFSTSAKGSYGVFSAGAKSSFVKEVHWDFNSNYVLVKATRITKKQSLNSKNAMLTQYSLNVLRDSKFKFLESCGNAFANTIELGGEIYGLIEIKSSNYEEKQKIEMSISGSGAYSGGTASGKADYEREIRKLSSTYKVKVNFQHIGGSTIEAPNTVEALLDLSNRIEEISDAHPVPISIVTRDYATLSNYIFDTNGPDEQIRQTNIDWAESKLVLARNLYAQILYILENGRDFKKFNEETLKQKMSYLDEKIILLKTFIAKSYSFVNESDITSLNLDLNVELPVMKNRAARHDLKTVCELKRSPLCGVETYREQKSSACGVVGPNEGTGPACGAVYKEEASLHCGVKLFKAAAGIECGVELWKQCHYGDPKYPGGSRPRGRKPECGAERYKTCRNINFGPAEFNTCRDIAHGVEKFNTCKSKDFGYEFETCEHFSHGPSTRNACEVAKIGTQETYCPQF